MRRSGFAVSMVGLAVAALLIASSAVARGETVRVRVAPKTVTAGASLFLSAGVSPAGKSCTPTITRPGARPTKLAAKRATAGAVSWRWTVPKTAKGGAGTVRVACTGAGAGSASFTIKALPPPPPPVIPARVVATKSGIAQRASSSTGSTFAGYGIVLQNVSPDEDAFRVTVLVNIVDAGGRILRSETDTYEEIPAGATYYAGGNSIYTGTAARLEVTATVGERRKRTPVSLPAVSNVRVQSNIFDEAEVLGEISNTSTTRTLSSLARVTIVCFDGAGNVVGGDFAFPPTDLPPGGRGAFETSVEGLVPSQIASVQVSVEPEFE